jgi:hypothetical protein
MRLMKRWVWKTLGVLLAIYLLFVGAMFGAMQKSPEEFSRFMMNIPMPLMMLTPFPPLWAQARAGSLHPGDAAPDFDLPRQGGGERVRLSQFHGARPVVLVFGSYT